MTKEELDRYLKSLARLAGKYPKCEHCKREKPCQCRVSVKGSS